MGFARFPHGIHPLPCGFHFDFSDKKPILEYLKIPVVQLKQLMKTFFLSVLLCTVACLSSSCGGSQAPAGPGDSIPSPSDTGHTRGPGHEGDFASKNPYWKGDPPKTETGEGAALICNCMADVLKESQVPMEVFVDKSLDELLKSDEARKHARALANTPNADVCLQLIRKTYADMGISQQDLAKEYIPHCRIPMLK